MSLKGRLSKNTLTVIKKLQAAGYQAYLVGGAVRDLLLEIRPKDHDLATNALPEQIKKVFGRRSKIIGRRFKLVHVYMGKDVFEVSTFRRKPSIEERKGRPTDSGLIVWRDNSFGSLEEDVMRRDFTVNAIYYDPFKAESKIVDVVGGLADLDSKRIRAIGDPHVRLVEDPVRMLRACKLAGQYGFDIDHNLKLEIKRNASDLELCSRARLLEELYKIFKKPFSCPTFTTCHDLGLLKYLLPSIGRRWNDKPGRASRKLLKIRGSKIGANVIYPSRVTGFCVMLMPFWNEYLGINAVDRQCAVGTGIERTDFLKLFI